MGRKSKYRMWTFTVNSSLEYFHLQFESASILLQLELKKLRKYTLKYCNFNWNSHSSSAAVVVSLLCRFQDHRTKVYLIPSRHTWTSAAFGWYASHHLYTILAEDEVHYPPLPSAVSDVDIPHICWGGGQVRVAGHTLWLRGAAVVLSLLQARLQQSLDLLLTCPQAVLQNTPFEMNTRDKALHVRVSHCVRMCLHTGSLPMTCDSRFVRFWEENEASRLFR